MILRLTPVSRAHNGAAVIAAVQIADRDTVLPKVIDMTEFKAVVTKITDVRPHGDNLSIVTIEGIDNEVVANRKEDGSFRWETGEPCVYVPEGAIIPEPILKVRGYWDDTKGKGLLEGKKGNRVKMRRFAGVESRGLLFKVGHPGQSWDEECPQGKIGWLDREDIDNETIWVGYGDDVTEFFGITEHQAG